MNKDQLKILTQNLQDQIKSTQNKIEEYSQICQPISPENAIGRISRMDAINNKSVVEAALRVAKDKMQQLKYVENKMNDPDFGICKKCKNIIPFERLMIQPESKFCVICAR